MIGGSGSKHLKQFGPFHYNGPIPIEAHTVMMINEEIILSCSTKAILLLHPFNMMIVVMTAGNASTSEISRFGLIPWLRSLWSSQGLCFGHIHA